MPNPMVIIIEDEKPIVNYLSTILSTQSYRIVATGSGREGLSLAASHAPDLILLDLGLPDIDGVEFIRSLRAWASIPILVVSARGQERDQIDALDAGADDYLTKPFKSGELLARMRALLRRASRLGSELNAIDADRFSYGPLMVDTGKRQVYVDSALVHLTPIEYKILLAFLRHPGKVLTHSFLQGQVWGQINEDQYGNLRVFVSGLRRKIQARGSDSPFIQTEIGVGYRFIELE